jgi:hypothetical protein
MVAFERIDYWNDPSPYYPCVPSALAACKSAPTNPSIGYNITLNPIKFPFPSETRKILRSTIFARKDSVIFQVRLEKMEKKFRKVKKFSKDLFLKIIFSRYVHKYFFTIPTELFPETKVSNEANKNLRVQHFCG